MVRTKETIRGHVYEITDPLGQTAISLKTKFEQANIPQNQVPYGDGNTLVLIVDKLVKEYVCGRLLKLRRRIPSVLNKKKATERDIPLLPEEDITETSHFVWVLADKRILGQYNYDGARSLAPTLFEYLNILYKRFQENDDEEEKELFEIDPIKNLKTIELFKKDLSKSIFVKVADANISAFESDTNSDIINLLTSFGSEEKQGYIEITVKPKRGKRLDKKKLLERIELLKKDNIVKSLIVEGENAKYDLLNNNLLPFNLDLTYDSVKRRVNSEEFYEEAINHYEKNRSVFI
ncbi:hypothetical protein HYV85_05600 [Candidatus Woesearchaeota archaeon]|nr:hypothetical protein [Candidatus Woesearchaeota archaeon]